MSHIGDTVHDDARKEAHKRQQGGAYGEGKSACAVHVFALECIICFLYCLVGIFFNEKADVKFRHVSDGQSAAKQENPLDSVHNRGGKEGRNYACINQKHVFHNAFMEQRLADVTVKERYTADPQCTYQKDNV